MYQHCYHAFSTIHITYRINRKLFWQLTALKCVFLLLFFVQCEQWCSSVKEFTEITPTTESITPGREKELINETDALMKQLAQAQLNSLKELAGCLHDKDIKKLMSKTLQKLVGGLFCNTCVWAITQYYSMESLWDSKSSTDCVAQRQQDQSTCTISFCLSQTIPIYCPIIIRTCRNTHVHKEK